MKAISLWQPWATAIALGSKRIETRSWPIAYRGELLIHAAKRCLQDEMRRFACSWNWNGALQYRMDRRDGPPLEEVLPFGAIVAKCDLIDCRPTGSFRLEEIEEFRFPPKGFCNDDRSAYLYQWTERQMGDFSLGRFGWVLDNIQKIDPPVYGRGQQGLFNVSVT